MKLTVLGSGTAAPLLDRNCAGYIIEADGKKLLFDSGAGTIRRLLELRYDLFDIEDIFYTHLHNDHINDLGAIIWSNNYGGIRKKPLNLYGPLGFKKYFDTLVNKLLKPTKINFKINVKELKNSTIKVSNIKKKIHEIRHSTTTKSIAYRIKHKNRTLVYAGDAEYCNEAIEIAKNADVLLIECSFPDNKKVKGHLTPSLAGRIASKAKVKRLILTHFYPQALTADIKKQCKKEFKGKIILAKDRMKINI